MLRERTAACGEAAQRHGAIWQRLLQSAHGQFGAALVSLLGGVAPAARSRVTRSRSYSRLLTLWLCTKSAVPLRKLAVAIRSATLPRANDVQSAQLRKR